MNVWHSYRFFMKINKEDILHTGNLELLAKKAVEWIYYRLS